MKNVLLAGAILILSASQTMAEEADVNFEVKKAPQGYEAFIDGTKHCDISSTDKPQPCSDNYEIRTYLKRGFFGDLFRYFDLYHTGMKDKLASDDILIEAKQRPVEQSTMLPGKI